MTNLEPRAKIGDVVIRKLTEYETDFQDEDLGKIEQSIIVNACCLLDKSDPSDTWDWEYLVEMYPTKQLVEIYDKDILKNLTTNISYEAND